MPAALFAMHLSDGLWTGTAALAWIVGGLAVAALLILIAGWKVPPDDVPKIGLLSAAFFVTSLIHIPVGVGSAHLILNGLLGVVLGRRSPLAVVVGITLQSFLFGHGGRTMIGINTVAVALPALAAGAIFPVLFRRYPRRPGSVGGLLGATAAFASIAINASVLYFTGREEFRILAGLFTLTNLPFVVTEGVATGVIVAYLAKVKPEWLGYSPSGNTSSNGISH